MRLARAFSTTIKLRHQQLYEPYIPSLNKKQQKSLRKEMSRDVPKYHPRISPDVKTIFRAYCPDEEFSKARDDAFQHLRKLVRSIGSGEEYDLVDVSIGRLKGSSDFYNAPLECVIVDKARPEGLPRSFGNKPLPVSYDAIALSRFLGANGYEGTIIDTRPDFVGYNASNKGEIYKPVLLQEEPAWGASGPVSQFKPFSTLFCVLPPVLRIQPEHEICPEICLSPVHPSHLLRSALIEQTCERVPIFGTVFSLFWLWLQSWGLSHFTPSTCAFLVLSYFQENYRLITLKSQGPDTDASDITFERTSTADGSSAQPDALPKSFWTRLDSGPDPEYYRLEAPQIAHLREPNIDKFGPLLFKFFSFWVNNNHLPYSQIFDIFAGTHVARRQKYKGSARDLDENQVMASLREQAEQAVKSGHNSNSSTKPLFWNYNPLVINDPFLPQHNLAHSVTKHALAMMLYRSNLAATLIKSGRPITDMFGGEVRPFRETRERTPAEVTANPPFLMRRMYHTRAVQEKASGDFFPTPPVPQSVLVARSKTMQRIQRAIQAKYGQHYKVECFGSTRYGVDSPSSDLDLVILDPERMNGFAPDVDISKLPPVYNIRRLGQTLEKFRFKVTRVISQASVPIVKFEDPQTHIKCDINVNDQLGLFNTMLIAKYCELSPLLRPMLVAIKKWAKSLGLNDPSGDKGTATFSSFALTLMTIGFLQSNELLPNLQADLTPLPDKPTSVAEGGFWLRAKSGEPVHCDPRFNREPAWQVPANAADVDLRKALCGWFRYWGHQHRYAQDVMSIRDGGIISRDVKAVATTSAEKQGKKRAQKAARNKKKNEKAKKAEPEAGPSTPQAVAGQLMDGEIQALELDKTGDSGTAPVPAVNADEAALEEHDKVDSSADHQPAIWAFASLVIVDPFILSKVITATSARPPETQPILTPTRQNATGPITVAAIDRFKAECRRAALLLENGCTFDDLLGEGDAFGRPGTSRGYPRRRGSKQKRSRSNSKGRVSNGPGGEVGQKGILNA